MRMVKNGVGSIPFCKQAKQNFHKVEQFEKAFAKKLKAKKCIAVNSGFSALFLSLWALGVRKGDEVLMPDFTMIATANAVALCGAKPVFVDIRMKDGNIDPSKIEEKITKRTKGIIVVHMYGYPASMQRILKIARGHKLFVIEDAAEAHGATYKGKYIGTIGDVGCFSFYSNKIISTGEGGAVVTNNEELAEEIKKLSSYYFSKGYLHEKLGFSFRMNPWGAEKGMAGISKLEETIRRKRQIAKLYSKKLEILPAKEEKGVCGVHWMIVLKTKSKIRDLYILYKNNVEYRETFFPMSLQPMYKSKKEETNALKFYNQTILLPSMPELKDNQIKRITSILCQ